MSRILETSCVGLTGHRRFLVIEVAQIDCDRIEADRDRIWKSAALAYQAGERPFLAAEDQEASNQRNKSFELENPFEASVGHWLRFGVIPNDQFTFDECLKGIDRCNLPHTDRHHVKEALKEHGCTPPRGQVRRNNVKVRLWTHYRAASAARSEVQSCVLAKVTGTQDSPSIVMRPSNGNDWDPSN